MPIEKPYWVLGEIRDIILETNVCLVKVKNGNIYRLTSTTPGIDVSALKIGDKIQCEVTSELTRVLSAKIIKS